MQRNFLRAVHRGLLAAAAAAPLAAAAASGQFTFVTGQVVLTKPDGRQSTPARGTPVDQGDRISTGANGMAQLTMVDQARLSLRPQTQFVIERYGEQRESADGAVLSLLKGTLRTFTGLLSSTNREKFVMKTRVATVGIRGSGNILYACDPEECDASVTGGTPPAGPITVNHTIEGAHAVTNLGADAGVPAQQGGAQTLITGPGQTVLVVADQAPRYIPTPSFIADAATSMVGAQQSAEAAPATGTTAETRNFSPSDTQALPASQQTQPPIVGNNGLGFPTIDATGNLGADPARLRDVILVAGSPFFGQAVQDDLTLEGNDLRGYRSYAGTGSGVQPSIAGGTLHDATLVTVDGVGIFLGRWANASLGFFGPGTGTQLPGSIHYAYAPSGYPTYLSNVLTGVATYELAGATAPTNQDNVAGSFGSATINVNFGNRTLGLIAQVSIPAAGANAGGTWQLSAADVPISLNAFFGSTADRLVIVNGAGHDSRTNNALSGSFEGSFVGTGLSGAILGYGISDMTSASAANWNFVSGAAAFAGPRQDPAAPYREGRVSDAAGSLTEFIRSYAATVRPDEVVADAEGRVTSFTAPHVAAGSHAVYDIGSAQVVESGFDPETGMVWGRWAGGVAQVAGQGGSTQLFLDGRSLHYVFAGTQSGPVALPLTGTAVYDVIGATAPTDSFGNVGQLNSATLNANFTNRTVDATVNIGINGQTWTGSASNMPIYRDQYFSAYSGTPIPGVPNPSPLTIGCQPNCGQGATGSIDGFFAGATGQRAGVMYNLGGNQGAIAMGRRGG